MGMIIETVKQGKPVPVPVIDTHVHLGACADSGLFQPFTSLDDTMQYCDDVGIDVLVTAPISLSLGDMKRTNREAEEAMAQYPGRIYGNIFVSPSDGVEAVKPVVDKYMKTPGFVGMKFLTGFFGEMDRPEYDYAIAAAVEAKCPVTIHIYGKQPTKKSVMNVLEKYPDLKLILAHQGGGQEVDTRFWADVMKEKHPSLYIDTCGSLSNALGLWEMAQLCGEDHLVYGSDILFMEPRYEIGRIIFSGMPEEVMKKILAENYLKILEGSQLSQIKL